MEVTIDYRAPMDRYDVFITSGHFGQLPDGSWVPLVPGDEIPVSRSFDRETFNALSKAILEHETPRLAEPALLREMLTDAQDTRDRILTMLEGELER